MINQWAIDSLQEGVCTAGVAAPMTYDYKLCSMCQHGMGIWKYQAVALAHITTGWVPPNPSAPDPAACIHTVHVYTAHIHVYLHRIASGFVCLLTGGVDWLCVDRTDWLC